jgi:hypothetical protein
MGDHMIRLYDENERSTLACDDLRHEFRKVLKDFLARDEIQNMPLHEIGYVLAGEIQGEIAIRLIRKQMRKLKSKRPEYDD